MSEIKRIKEEYSTEYFDLGDGCSIQVVTGVDGKGVKYRSVRFVAEEWSEGRGTLRSDGQWVTRSVRLPSGEVEAYDKLIAVLTEIRKQILCE